jgi:hypothetical protein
MALRLDRIGERRVLTTIALIAFVAEVLALGQPNIYGEPYLVAKNIVAGKGFVFIYPYSGVESVTCYIAPLYAFFDVPFLYLGKIIGIPFFGERCIQVANLLMLQAACYVLYRFFKQFVTTGTALFIFATVSFYIPFWILSYSLEPNALNILLVALTIEMLYRIATEPSRKRWILLGVLIGIQLWVRPDILIGIVLFALWLILFAKDKLNNKIKGLALSIAIALAIIAPWTIRNYVTFHRFVFISANSGMNLYEGNNYVATGQFGTLPPTPESERENAQILTYQATHDAIDIDEYRLHLAEQWMLTHPMQVIELDLKKALWHWIGRSEVGEQYHYGRHTLAVFYRVVSLLLLPLGFYGLILWKDRILKSLIVTMFIYSTAISAIFFVQSRHRTLKVDPFLVPLATIGLVRLVQIVEKRKHGMHTKQIFAMEEVT